ncbi:MAG: RNA 2',3'-cyclic phosphodiesterase [Bacteroidales bacterium]|nr:RNA 2',3'-cyclic phosphodiesterase [Bacteroidales bacterium]
MKRLFVAVKIHPDDQFKEIYVELRKKLILDKIKWIEPQNLHLTLKFLGKTPTEDIKRIDSVLKEVAARHSIFGMSMQNSGIFGSRYDPRVIWLGTDNNQDLTALGEDVLNSLDEAGFERDRQNFVPHLTLGRIKQLTNKKYFQDVISQYHETFFQKQVVEQFYLFESILQPSGPVYKVLKSYDLKQ